MTIAIMMMISIIVFKLHEWFVPGARSIVCASRLKHCQHPHPSKRGMMMMTKGWFPSKSLDPMTIMMNWWYLLWWRMKINQFHPSCYSATICKCLTCFHSFKTSLVSLTTALAFVVCFVQSFWLGFVPPSHFCIFQSEFNLQCSPFVPQTNPLLPFSSELQWASQSDWVTIVFPMMMMMTMMIVITMMMVMMMMIKPPHEPLSLELLWVTIISPGRSSLRHDVPWIYQINLLPADFKHLRKVRYSGMGREESDGQVCPTF